MHLSSCSYHTAYFGRELNVLIGLIQTKFKGETNGHPKSIVAL
jgi:hypothetical protein